MEYSEFSIGTEFFTEAGQWRCTDIGARTIIAIKISGISVTASDGKHTSTKDVSGDPTWFNGPPYAVGRTCL